MSKTDYQNVYTDDFSYLVGSMMGDGCLYVGRDTYQFSITSEDLDFCEKCQLIVHSLFNKDGNIKTVYKDNGEVSYHQLVVCSKDMVFFLKELTCDKTIIPSFVFKSKKKMIAFIQGIMDSDGWISKVNASDGHTRYRVGFKNNGRWAVDARRVIEELGVRTGEIREVSNSRSKEMAFTFTINTCDYCKKIGFRIGRKISLQKEFLEFYNKTSSKDSKTENIIIRVSKREKTILDIKSKMFSMKRSDYLRHCAFSSFEDAKNDKHFKELLKMYQDGNRKDVVEILFEYYRRNGFPHVELTAEQKENRMKRIINSKNILVDGDNLQMNYSGMDLANSFHPHMAEAYYKRGDNSPIETFNDDDGLRDCINRWMELGKTPNPAGIRRILKTRDGTRGVVNFKSTVAKFIYDNYAPDNGIVLDPCSGYSGRLAGCIASNRNLLYHGIDPNGKTSVGNMQMASFFSTQYEELLHRRVYSYRFKFDLGCAEDVMPTLRDDYYDLVFTSPPYYDIEIYSDDNTQSSFKYNDYELWKNKFLFKIVDESSRLLKANGFLVLNVKNSYDKKIADDLCSYCEKEWRIEKIYHMRLPNREYCRKEGNTFHSEPIFVFRKSS